MENKLIILYISILIISTGPSVVFADVIEPGMKDIKPYYKISNIDNYPDYIFLIHGTPFPPYELINSSEFNFYKFSTASIYALKKSDFNEKELRNMNDLELVNFFNSSTVIKSNIELQGSFKQVSINDPLEKVTIVLNITSLNENEMEIQKTRVIYAYADGTSQEEIFKDQNTIPEPSKSDWASILWYIVIPVLAIIAIAVILISRKFK